MFDKTPPKGMRDILPEDLLLREKISDTIKGVYRSYGFTGIETPCVEDLGLLTSKQGGDNEKLIFKILKRGEKLENSSADDLCDLGLRYDLTVPLTRYFANNCGKLPSVFKAMQTGSVWRAERPQKGRFRQFVQCDIDIINEESFLAETELILATGEALEKLGLPDFCVRVNDRRLLKALALACGFCEKDFDKVFVTLDKLDKIGADGVKAELTEKGFAPEAVQALDDFLRAGDFSLDTVAAKVDDEALTADLRYVIAASEKVANGRYGIAYAPSLVRGQGYYTGMVFEVTCPQFSGAVAGGGRYDNMVGKFIGQQVPAVGFSIGFERVCGILLEQGYQIPGAKPKMALLYLKDADFAAVLAKAEQLRADYDVTVLPQAKKLGKQFGTLEAAGYNAVAFADNDDIKVLGQKAE